MISKQANLSDLIPTHSSVFRSVSFALPSIKVLYTSNPMRHDRVFALRHTVRVATKRRSNDEQWALMRRWSDVTTWDVMRTAPDGVIELDHDLLVLKARAYIELILEMQAAEDRNAHPRDNSEQVLLELFSNHRRLDRLTRYISRCFEAAHNINSTLEFLRDATNAAQRVPSLQSAVEVGLERLLHLVSHFRSCDTRLKAVVAHSAEPRCCIDKLFRGIQRGFNSRFPLEFRVAKERVCAHAAAIAFIRKFDQATFLGTLIEPFHPLFLWQQLSHIQTVLPPWYPSARPRLLDRLTVEREQVLAAATMTTVPVIALPYMSPRQREIVREIKKLAPALVTQKELIASINWSRGSVQRDLAELEMLGIVHRPKGTHNGYQLTEPWREQVAADPALFKDP